MRLAQGLTLIEVLVALFIASMIALMSHRLLSHSFQVYRHIHGRLEEQFALQRVFALVRQDLFQAFPFYLLNQQARQSEEIPYAFIGRSPSLTPDFLSFLILRPPHLADILPPVIVAYRYHDHCLIRQIKAFPSQKILHTDVLLQGIQSLHVRYFVQYNDVWLTHFCAKDQIERATPSAIAWSLTIGDKDFERVFKVSAI